MATKAAGKKTRELLLSDGSANGGKRLMKVEISRTVEHEHFNHHYYINPITKKEEMFLEPVNALEPEED